VEDFDAIRWYVMHDTSWVWVDDGDWYLQVEQACTQLGPEGECLIYATRPSICRDYGLPQQDQAPDEPPCDYFTRGGAHDMEFRTPGEVERYIDEYRAAREDARRRRSEAARRGWATRRARRTRSPGVPRHR
jgi:Fe-S-cluster containining protein